MDVNIKNIIVSLLMLSTTLTSPKPILNPLWLIPGPIATLTAWTMLSKKLLSLSRNYDNSPTKWLLQTLGYISYAPMVSLIATPIVQTVVHNATRLGLPRSLGDAIDEVIFAPLQYMVLLPAFYFYDKIEELYKKIKSS